MVINNCFVLRCTSNVSFPFYHGRHRWRHFGLTSDEYRGNRWDTVENSSACGGRLYTFNEESKKTSSTYIVSFSKLFRTLSPCFSLSLPLCKRRMTYRRCKHAETDVHHVQRSSPFLPNPALVVSPSLYPLFFCRFFPPPHPFLRPCVM